MPSKDFSDTLQKITLFELNEIKSLHHRDQVNATMMRLRLITTARLLNADLLMITNPSFVQKIRNIT